MAKDIAKGERAMKLSDRKKKILRYVVDDYIATAQPVSSKSITERHMPDVSSATVRSELAGLEELGFLTQLHTSSGRVPSIEAYKLYAKELIGKDKLTHKEIMAIRKAFESHADNLEDVVKSVVEVITSLTDYTSVAYTERDENEKILKIDIFRYRPRQALLLIVTENTLIKDKVIDIPDGMTDEQIKEASVIISNLVVGKEVSSIRNIGNVIGEEFFAYREIFDRVMTAIEEYIENDKGQVIMEGEDKLLSHPDYNDSVKVKNFLSVITSKDRLKDLLAEDNEDIEINIKIAGEDDVEDLKDCSIVTASYSASGVKIGTYGVIGPLRMDYGKVVAVLEGVGRILEEILKN